MSKQTIEIGGTVIEASVYEETHITYDAHAKVNGRSFSAIEFEDEEEALDDLKAQIIEAFPELAAATPEEAEAIKAATPLWMRINSAPALALQRWQNGEPLPTPPLREQIPVMSKEVAGGIA